MGHKVIAIGDAIEAEVEYERKGAGVDPVVKSVLFKFRESIPMASRRFDLPAASSEIAGFLLEHREGINAFRKRGGEIEIQDDSFGRPEVLLHLIDGQEPRRWPLHGAGRHGFAESLPQIVYQMFFGDEDGGWSGSRSREAG